MKTLEREKQELIQEQGSKKSNIINLQNEVESLKGQLQDSHMELAQQKNLYNQLK